MDELQDIKRANNRDWLWPPVADAVDTFLRRRDRKAGSFERIWRLIHVWESVNITLASVAVAHMRLADPQSTGYRRAREALFGRAWNDIDRTFKTSQGALDGSIDRWIDILLLVTKLDQVDDAFLLTLREFLECEAIDLRPLVQVWATACDVPSDADRDDGSKCKVKIALRHLNTFRNRFAHVPFPYDPIDKLADAFERVTEQLFSIATESWKPRSVLCGGIAQGSTLLRGRQQLDFAAQTNGDASFVFPLSADKAWKPETCDASPFVYIDQMARPYVLTRLKDREHGTWEYTRYRAEANAVLTQDDENLLGRLPEPTESEYPTDEADTDAVVVANDGESVEQVGATQQDSAGQTPDSKTPDRAQCFADAIEAIRNEDFDPAILFFEDLVVEKPGYHIGWLRLGHAKREKAARLRLDDPTQAVELLHASIKAFSEATEHRDPEYQATAHYERSKARHRLCGISYAADEADAARADALDACRLSADTRYQTWLDYFERMMPPTATK